MVHPYSTTKRWPGGLHILMIWSTLSHLHHFTLTKLHQTKPNLEPTTPQPPQTHSLSSQGRTCQHASYHWAGSQMISSPGYKCFEGEEMFLSEFCLRFSEGSEY